MRRQFLGTLAFVACGVVVLSNGCSKGPKEGEICNALIAQNECSEGTCQLIGSCTTGYCCPTDPSTSTSPFCNGMSCPPLPEDGGDEGGMTEGGADSPSEGMAEATAAVPEAGAEAAVEAAAEAAVDSGPETSTPDAQGDGSVDAGGG
jgi:hypothetical protein